MSPTIRVTVAFLLILVGLVVWTHGQNEKLHEGQLSSCRRVNVLRAQSNITDLAVWRILSGAGRRELALVERDPKNAATHRRSADTTIRNASQVAITALTDCNKAVNDPTTYQFPIAGPIGDPATGREAPEVRAIERQSRALVRRQQARVVK